METNISSSQQSRVPWKDKSLGQREISSPWKYGASVVAVAGFGGLVYRRYFGSHALFTKLKRDHRMVAIMLQSLQLMPRNQAKARKDLFNKMKRALLAHAKSEEETIYLALKTKRRSHTV